MIAIIPAASYCDQDIFDLEQDKIFSRGWTFAGLKSALSQDNSWITAAVAGKSVVIQNFGGELRCFLNVCSHRFCEIRIGSEGSGPLRCPYHGWTYNSEGSPVGIPHRPRFDNLCIGELGLTRYRAELCGELVFVNTSNEVPDLRASMGNFFEEIALLSAGMGSMVDSSEWSIDCNWKILVENTLEAYHVGFVHPGTFAKLNADFGDFRFDAQSSSFLGRTNLEAAPVRKLLNGYPSRPGDVSGYFHFHLFPFFLMSTSYGIVFSVQEITPLSPSKTSMRSRIFHRAADPGTKVGAAMEPILHNMAAEFNTQVLKEDQNVCESVQRGAARVRGRFAMLSDEELRVERFQRIYAGAMRLDPVESHPLSRS
jgi:phenylpropionate dioxygenase-like ring-hydroxylating dioxygenase large terminal subunit